MSEIKKEHLGLRHETKYGNKEYSMRERCGIERTTKKDKQKMLENEERKLKLTNNFWWQLQERSSRKAGLIVKLVYSLLHS